MFTLFFSALKVTLTAHKWRLEYGERRQETSCLLRVRGLQNYIRIEDLQLFSDHPTAFLGASLQGKFPQENATLSQ